MANLTDRQRGVLRVKNFYTLSTIGKDGAPRSTTIWGEVEGDDVLLNTAEGRGWLANIRRDPRVAIAVFELGDPYNQVSLTGRVVEITAEGGQAGIDMLSEKYTGEPRYPTPPGAVRVHVRVALDAAHSWGD